VNDTQDWRHWAACQDENPEWWFPTAAAHTYIYKREVKRAKDICASCPIIDDCLREAVREGHVHGVWGGTSEELRKWLRKPRPGEKVRLPPQRPQCGSEAGAAAHRRRKEPLCDHCRREAAWARARRAGAAS
jgi:WhiB family redox-sensing transcriptional regulator